ncbi:hypothetical protein RND59_04535 [Vibrio ruber]|nr:hypothetical protein [Vibrio ruber]WNJ96370.1 hypothetical protein RND59_04535 [Vibrio ruber]
MGDQKNDGMFDEPSSSDRLVAQGEDLRVLTTWSVNRDLQIMAVEPEKR